MMKQLMSTARLKNRVITFMESGVRAVKLCLIISGCI